VSALHLHPCFAPQARLTVVRNSGGFTPQDTDDLASIANFFYLSNSGEWVRGSCPQGYCGAVGDRKGWGTCGWATLM
jgi:hypothetical protein